MMSIEDSVFEIFFVDFQLFIFKCADGGLEPHASLDLSLVRLPISPHPLYYKVCKSR